MKRILFIGISWYNYANEIITVLMENGFEVSYYPIEPRTIYFRGLHNVSEYLYNKAMARYHLSLINNEKTKNYDFIFFIQVHHFSFSNIELLKQYHPNTPFILYNWDSIETHDYRPYIKYFDRVFTFDPVDAKNYSLFYLPLFLIPSIEKLSNLKVFEYDIYFIGSIGSIERYLEIKKFTAFCRKEKLRFEKFLHCSPVFFIKLILNGYFPNDISFSPISIKKFHELIQKSIAVFDYPNHIQNGYTMRLIENLCSGKKIITNNSRIKDEYFYSEDRILLIKDSDFSNVRSFLKTDIRDPDNNFSEFSLYHWINKILYL